MERTRCGEGNSGGEKKIQFFRTRPSVSYEENGRKLHKTGREKKRVGRFFSPFALRNAFSPFLSPSFQLSESEICSIFGAKKGGGGEENVGNEVMPFVTFPPPPPPQIRNFPFSCAHPNVRIQRCILASLRPVQIFFLFGSRKGKKIYALGVTRRLNNSKFSAPDAVHKRERECLAKGFGISPFPSSPSSSSGGPIWALLIQKAKLLRAILEEKPFKTSSLLLLFFPFRQNHFRPLLLFSQKDYSSGGGGDEFAGSLTSNLCPRRRGGRRRTAGVVPSQHRNIISIH